MTKFTLLFLFILVRSSSFSQTNSSANTGEIDLRTLTISTVQTGKASINLSPLHVPGKVSKSLPEMAVFMLQNGAKSVDIEVPYTQQQKPQVPVMAMKEPVKQASTKKVSWDAYF